ncbi:U6 snRNA-associated Sm-like protein LSm2 [Paramecium bursaria]
MFFLTFFKGLIEKSETVTVELKNGLQITGQITYVDQNLNFNLLNPEVPNQIEQPQFVSLKNTFIRGSNVRYIHIPDDIDKQVMIEACRNEVKKQKQQQ